MLRFGVVMVVCAFSFLILPAQADTVTTKDGRKLTGEILKQDDTGLDLKIKFGVVRIAAKDIESVTKESFSKGREGPSEASTQPEKAPLDPESQALTEKLRKEIAEHRKELAGQQKELAKTPRTTEWHRVQPGDGVGGMFRKRGPEPNPDYSALQAQIQKVQLLITVKNTQIADLNAGGAARQVVLDAARKAEAQAAKDREERARVVAELQKRFGGPVTTADQAVAILLDAKALLDSSAAVSKETVDSSKALLFKSLILGLSIAAKNRDAVVKAPPAMSFCAVNYNFKFITQAGLERHNLGYVILCEIDEVWWPVEINIDGMSAYWEAMEHPLVRSGLMQDIVKAYRQQVETHGEMKLGSLRGGAAVKITESKPAPKAE